MLKIYIYWHKCWCNGCGTGQVKIELLSFWSVNRWVSQLGIKGCLCASLPALYNVQCTSCHFLAGHHDYNPHNRKKFFWSALKVLDVSQIHHQQLKIEKSPKVLIWEKSTPDCPPSRMTNTGSWPVPPPTGVKVVKTGWKVVNFDKSFLPGQGVKLQYCLFTKHSFLKICSKKKYPGYDHVKPHAMMFPKMWNL